MSRPRPSPARSLQARLDAARDRAFVGRTSAIDLFRQALEAEEPPYAALFIHGPGGVGKTTLVRRLLAEAEQLGFALAELDGHVVPPKHDEVLSALGVTSLEAIPDAFANRRLVVAIDTYEQLAPLDDWVRRHLAPALPERAILLIAGRDGPSAGWRTDPGWASLLATIALRNLSADESSQLLAARGVPSETHDAIHTLTYGHPLALALVADLRRQGDVAEPRFGSERSGSGEVAELTPAIVRVLLEAMLRTLPGPRHREALEVAALARHVDLPLLAALAADEDGTIYEWLRSLSFVDATSEGLYLHDLVRDALLVDANAKDPAGAHARRSRLSRRAADKLLGATGRVRERAAYDLLHLYRGDPTMRPYYAWAEKLGGSSRPMRPDELDALLALAREHEGPDAARIARDLHDRHPGAFFVLEGPAGDRRGYLVYLRLDAETLELEAARTPADPVMVAVHGALRTLGPLRSGEHCGLLRFWFWVDKYQDLGSPAHVPHSAHVMIEWCSSPGLGPVVLVVQRFAEWEPFFRGIGFCPIVEKCGDHGRVALGGRTFHLFHHDFRLVPPSQWMSGVRDAPAVPPRQVLAREDFESAIRDALRACATRPGELRDNPLLTSRVLADWAEGDEPRPEMIRELLDLAVASLTDERDDRPRRAVELTYLRPAPSQEIAAERLGMSFSTYRRQLARGVEGVIAFLWQREICP